MKQPDCWTEGETVTAANIVCTGCRFALPANKYGEFCAVITARNERSLRYIAEVMGMSHEMVRRIEQEALEKLKGHVV